MDRFEEAKLKVKEATDVVELIQGYVPLTRRGRYFVALCPFHAEKTPSFTVHPETQHFKCFGCGKAGDVFTFLMEREGLSFREAMEALGDSAGVDLDGVFGRGVRRRGPKHDIAGTLAQVQEFFASVLKGPEGRVGREYLAERDLLEAIDDFGLGLHPPMPGALRNFASQRKLPFEVLQQAGVISQDGRREPLLGRLIFPIVDERNRVVGFGGRVLPGEADDRRPKYVNSPESPFFNKRRLLYGLRHAKQAGTRRIVVVEGYTDVIACHLVGMTGTVATLGTSLTVEHAKLLQRYATDGVVLLFDGDRAGRQAAERAFRELVHTPLPVRMALLPEGCDPADLCEDGNARLAAVVDGAEDALTMWFRLLRQRFDLGLDVDVERAAGECSQILAEVENPARQQALRRGMARHLGLSEAALPAGKSRRRARRDEPEAPMSPAPPPAPEPVDRMREPDLDLVACLLADPNLLRDSGFESVCAGGFATPRVSEVVEWIGEARSAGRQERDAIVGFLFAKASEDSSLQRFLADSVERARRIRDPQGIFSRLRQGRQTHFAREQARQTRVRLREAEASGDRELVAQLTETYVALLRKSRDEPPGPIEPR